MVVFITIIFTILLVLVLNIIRKFIVPPKEFRHLRGGNFFAQLYALIFSNLPGPYLQRLARQKYGKIVRQKFGGVWVAIVHDDEEAVKTILKNNDVFEKFQGENARSETAEHFFGLNIVAENGENWQRLRRICNPAFHWEYLRSFVDRFSASSNKVFEYIEHNDILKTSPKIKHLLSEEELKNEGKKYTTVEVVPLMQKLTLDVLGDCAFSQNFGSFDEKEGEYVTLYNRIMKNLFFPLNLLFKNYDKLPLPSNRILKSDLNRFEGLLQGVIQKRREEIKSNSANVVERDPDLLDMMIQNEGGMTDNELKHNMNIFFLAGHDTTSTALSMALNFLAMYPDIQEKAREEARTVLKDKINPTFDDVKELHYITQIIKETLRHWPPVSILPSRITTEDVVVGGHQYPKGTIFTVCIYSLHHSPEYWENPEKFDPDRFAPNKKISPYVWLPFGVGPRVCIGNNFSLIEQKVFLATLLLRYRIHPGPIVPSKQHNLTGLNFELSSLNFLIPQPFFNIYTNTNHRCVILQCFRNYFLNSLATIVTSSLLVSRSHQMFV